MISISRSINVSRSCHDCFHYLSDLRKLIEWDSQVTSSSKIGGGPVGRGSTFKVTLSAGYFSYPMTYVITHHTPSQKIVLEGRSLFFTVKDTIEFSERDGGTDISYQMSVYPKLGFGTLLNRSEDSLNAHADELMKALLNALQATPPEAILSTRNAKADKVTWRALRCFTRYGYVTGQRDWHPMSERLEGQHVLLTGANSGIGLAAAIALAAAGAELTLVVRSQQKADETAATIMAETGRSDIDFELADLSLMSDTEALVSRLIIANRKIDVLINNAGALFNEHSYTSEGLEQSYALLLLSPWRLTEALKPLLVASQSPSDDIAASNLDDKARVINVVSGGMYAERLNLKRLNMSADGYRGARAYAQCKRALSVMTEIWANRWENDNIVVNAMHPGWSDTPGVQKSLPLFRKITRLVLRSHKEGADTIVWMAQSRQAALSSGKLFLDREPRSTYLLGNNVEKPEAREGLEAKIAADFTSALKP